MKKVLFFLVLVLSVMTMRAGGIGETLVLPEFNSGKAVWIVRVGVGFNGVVGSAKETQALLWENGKWDGSFKTNPGYVVSFGFNKSFGKHPLYWGMEFDLAMRGYKTKAEKFYDDNDSPILDGGGYRRYTAEGSLTTYNLQLSPIMIGYKYTFLERMAVDVHVGAYASYDFAGNERIYDSKHLVYHGSTFNRDDFEENENKVKIKDMDTMRKYDVGMNLGLGYWFGRFNIDFSWQRGFIPIYEGGDETVTIGGKKGEKREKGNLFSNNFQLRIGYAF